MLHNNPFDFNSFLLYLIPLTIGPAFLSGSIYLCLVRIIVVYGDHVSRLRPRTYAILFMCSDFISLLLQAIGGAISATANDRSTGNTGRYIMIAGLSFQVVSLLVFMILWVDFILAVRRAGGSSASDPKFRDIRASPRFKAFQYALWVATILIFIRSVYRVAELQGGFGGKIANDQTVFMIFEGPMIIVATLILTVLHPGFAFSGKWHTAAWSLRGRKVESDMPKMEQ